MACRRGRDSFTCAIAHAENGVGILDCLVEVKAPFNPDTATAQIAGVLRSYGCASTRGDRYSGQWVIQTFTRNGITYHHSERDRSAIHVDVLPLLGSGRVRLLDNKSLVYQFASLERSSSPAGKERVDHGVGGHDDLCNSAAGALLLAAGVNRWWENPAWAQLPMPTIAERPAVVWNWNNLGSASAIEYANDPRRRGFGGW
jgi:hypothetical protein